MGGMLRWSGRVDIEMEWMLRWSGRVDVEMEWRGGCCDGV